MRRHKKKENVIARTDRKQNSLNPLILQFPQQPSFTFSTTKIPFPLAGGTSTEIHRKDSLDPLNSFFFFSHTARIQPKKNA